MNDVPRCDESAVADLITQQGQSLSDQTLYYLCAVQCAGTGISPHFPTDLCMTTIPRAR